MRGLSKRDKEKLAKTLGVFLRQYGRKAPKRPGAERSGSYEPNIQEIIRKLKPDELDALMNSEDGERSGS